jgi:endonuclease G
LQRADFGLPQTYPNDEIVRHYAYTLSYSEKDEEAYWVAYTFRNSYLYGGEKRTNRFEADPDVPTGSSEPDDYRNSGYDKGHLAPAADMKWNKEAMQESFYLSNVCPQDHKFNDGIWADLEKAVRSWVKEDTIEYIVTGPVLPAVDCPKIGKDHVTVPSYFYKVIFSPCPYPKAIGFIIPNAPGRQSFWHYACTVSQVENTTHIHFFPEIPANIMKEIKDRYEVSDWRSTRAF